MRITRLVPIAAALLVSWSAYAADPASSTAEHPQMNALHQACAADITQFCSGVEPGQGRIVRCLRDNEDKLSQSCKDARAAARSHKDHKTAPQ